jgi:chromosome segregation ATPase
MRRVPSFLFTWLLLVPSAFCQAGPTDTQINQALLTEIRLLRQDLRTTAVTIQRAQIVMYRLQAQAQLVSRATQRVDEARNRCNAAQMDQRRLTTLLEQTEPKLLSIQDPIEKKRLEEVVAQVKANLAQVSTDEQNCHARETEADSALRAEQAKLDALQDQLEKLDKALASLGGQ